MSGILDRPFEEDDESPMPQDINLLFSWMTKDNVVQCLPRTEEIIAHMRKLRAGWEDEGKPIKNADKPEKTIDIMKLIKPDGKPLIAPPTGKIRRL